MNISSSFSKRVATTAAALALGVPVLSGAATPPPDAAARGLNPAASGSYTCPIDLHVRLTVKLSAPSTVRFYSTAGPDSASPKYTSPSNVTTAAYTYNARSVNWTVAAVGDLSITSVGESCVP